MRKKIQLKKKDTQITASVHAV